MTGPHLYASPEQTHYVYRCFDSADALLYVGCSMRPAARVEEHRRRVGGHLIARYEATAYPDRQEALLHERMAISTERPQWNVKGRTYDDELEAS